MSQNTKALRVRIKSVTATLQLTKAMGLVASSKIRRANEAMLKGREYAASWDDTLSLLASDRETANSPFCAVRGGDRTRLIVIAGDRGLAGGYNANVFRLAATYPDAEIIPIGKRACERFGRSVVSSEHFTFADAVALSRTLCADFKHAAYDRLGILYTRYHSVMSQEAVVQWVLPLTMKSAERTAAPLFEPDATTVLNHVMQEYVAGILTACVRESFASEVAARRMAMDSAGKNATQMIDDLQLAYNRARQGAITQEITEIVAGSGDGTR